MYENFGYDVVSNLLSNLTVKHILSMRAAVANEGTIVEFWNGADGELFYYSKLNEVGGDDESNLFALADYLTLIPYGEEGYALFGDYIRRTEGISAEEWRYKTFMKLLGPDEKRLSDYGRTLLKRFFLNRNLSEVHYDDLCEAAAGLLRLRHKAEAVAATVKGMHSYVGSPKDWDDMFQRLADEFPEKKVMGMNELLSCFSDPAPLNEEEKEFVKSAKERIERVL